MKSKEFNFFSFLLLLALIFEEGAELILSPTPPTNSIILVICKGISAMAEAGSTSTATVSQTTDSGGSPWQHINVRGVCLGLSIGLGLAVAVAVWRRRAGASSFALNLIFDYFAIYCICVKEDYFFLFFVVLINTNRANKSSLQFSGLPGRDSAELAEARQVVAALAPEASLAGQLDALEQMVPLFAADGTARTTARAHEPLEC